MKSSLQSWTPKKTALITWGCVATLFGAQAGTIPVPSGVTYALDASTDYSSSTFDMSGGTLDLNGRTASVGGIAFSGTGLNVLTNGGESATLTYAGDFRADTGTDSSRRVCIAGGRHVFDNGKILLGNNDDNATATNSLVFEIDGDDTVLSVAQSAKGYFCNRSQLTMNICGGMLELTGKSNPYVALQKTGSCTINIAGGTFTMEEGILNCYKGKVDINVSGGRFAPAGIWMGGYQDSGNRPHVLTMTGGELDVGSEFTVFYKTGFTADCTVNLNGGVARVAYLRANVPTTTAVSAFTADGGTMKPYTTETKNNADFFRGFHTARLGERGLTFDAVSAITVVQDFNGLADGAGYGTIKKTGAAALTLAGALCDGVRFENREGETTLKGASGAVRVTAMAGNVTLSGAGKLGANSELNAKGGTITLDGAVDPTTSAVALNGTLAVNVATTLASLTLGDETAHGNLVLGENVDLTVTGEFNGSLEYSRGNYEVTKDGQGRTHIVRVAIPAKTLEIRLDETGVTSNATESSAFNAIDTLAATVALDSTLTLSGLYKRGAFTKDGTGAAVLTNPDNLFVGGVSCTAGRLAANPFFAFGLTGVPGASLTLAGGTLEVLGGGPITYEGALNVNAGSDTAAVIFKTASDMTLRSFNHTRGALIKRGAGRLTIDSQNRAAEVVLSRAAGNGALTSTTMTFDDQNGTVPTTGYAGFNVAEGELCLANGTFRFDGITTKIGMPLSSEPTAPVRLTVTNATVFLKEAPGGNYSTFAIGSGLKDGDAGQNVSVQILDSTLSGATVSVGGYGAGEISTSADARVYVGITNSVVDGWRLNMNKSGGKTYLRASNSQFRGGVSFRGYVEADFDNCLYAKMVDNVPQMRAAPEASNGYLGSTGGSWTRFTGGSRVYVNTIGGISGEAGSGYRNTLIFDGATWFVNSDIKAIWNAGKDSKGEDYEITYHVKTEGAGVTVSRDEGLCQCTVKLEGDGGLTKVGAGTFFFDTRSKWNAYGATETKCPETFAGGTTTWDFTGPVDIRKGALAVTNGAIAATMSPTVHIADGATWQLLGGVTLTNATLSGSGTVEGGTLVHPTVKLMAPDGRRSEGPVFTGTVAGTLTVDFGCTPEKPIERPFPKRLRVATLPPGARTPTFRVTGFFCDGASASVFRVGDEVLCSVKSGIVILVK